MSCLKHVERDDKEVVTTDTNYAKLEVVKNGIGLMARSKDHMPDDPIPINKSIIIPTINVRASWS